MGKLDGKKVAILVTDGFEQVEMTKPREALEEAGAETEASHYSYQRDNQRAPPPQLALTSSRVARECGRIVTGDM